MLGFVRVSRGLKQEADKSMRAITGTKCIQCLLCLGLSLFGLGCGLTDRDREDSGVGGSAGDSGDTDESKGSGGKGGETSGSGGAGTIDPEDIQITGTPLFTGFVRLTHLQWQNSIQAIFELPSLPSDLPPFSYDVPVSTFTNNEKSLLVDERAWTEHLAAASVIAERVAMDALALERLGGVEDPVQFIRKVGKRAFRRELTEPEVARFSALWAEGIEIADQTSLGSDAADGARIFIEALLTSPHFLYRIELTPEGERLSGLELATRLSLLLIDTTPSDALLEKAASGGLDTNEGLLEAAAELLEQSRASETLARFYSELFELRRYPNLESPLFPGSAEEFKQSLLTADELLFAHLVEQQGGLRDLLTTPLAIVDPITAPLYGVDPPSQGFVPVELPERPGILTRLGFLTARSLPTEPSPVHRGSFIVGSLLCRVLEVPASGIPTIPEMRMPGQTMRDWLTEATADAPCAECHAEHIHPLGFAFENYDALGRLRTTDNGSPVDTSGSYRFSGEEKTFSGAAELATLLAEDQRAHACFSAHLAEFVLARDLDSADRSGLDGTIATSHEDSASLKELTLELIQSPLFTTAR